MNKTAVFSYAAGRKILLATILAIPLFALNARADITTGLVGLWAFDDGSGASATNSVTGNPDGALTGFSDTGFTSMWVAGRFGEALLFNANDDTNAYVSVPDPGGTLFNFNGGTRACTLAAWVYCNLPGGSESNSANIICKGASGQEQYALYISNGVFQVLVRNSAGSGVQTVASTVTPAAKTWYHVVATWSSNPQINQIYVNGAFNNLYSGGGFRTSELTTALPVTIGSKEPGSANYAAPFEGLLDDVRIYNRVLSASDIYELYTNRATVANAPAILTQPRNATAYVGDSPVFSVTVNSSTTLLPVTYQWKFNGTNIPGATASTLTVSNAQSANLGTYTVSLTNFEGSISSANALLALQSLPAVNTNSGLVGWWKFDDASGSTAADSSGNGNAGTLSGFADTSYSSMWVAGVFGDAVTFNGDATGLNVVAVPNIGVPAPPVLDFSSQPVFSVAAWVNGSATQTDGAGIIAKGSGSGGEEYALDISGGNYRFHVMDTNGTVFTAQTAVAPNGTWQHLAGVLNASAGLLNCYVNGKLAASSAAPFSLQTNSQELSIGNLQPVIGAYGDPFTGAVDDVKIYHRDLTSADVAALYAAKPSPLSISWPTVAYDLVSGINAQLAPLVQGGVPPFTYQWRYNGTNIPGATASPLVLTNAASAAAGSYDVIVSDYNYVSPATSSVVSVTIVPYLTFNSNGATWTAQGSTPSAIWQGTNVAQLTPLVNSQSNSIFYSFPVNTGVFQAAFTYQVTAIPGGTTGPGEGLAFCIQNDPRGASAIGYGSAGLGVGTIPDVLINPTITPSVEFEFSCGSSTSTTTTGVSWDVNGAIGPFASAAPIAFDTKTTGGNPINVIITCVGGVAMVSLTDTNAGTQFSVLTNLNVASILGSTNGYVGFTASTGAPYAAQQVSDFTFKNVASPVFTYQPFSSTNISSGDVFAVSAGAIGSAPLAYQWVDENNNPVPGATNAALLISSLSTNNTFALQVSNPYGTNLSGQVSVTVISGAPQLEQDVASTTAVVGSSIVLSASFAGTLPITYGWQSNGVAVTNGGRVSGATTSALKINNVQFSDAATYQLFATNSFSPSGQTSQAALTVAPTLSFNGNGSGWSAQSPTASLAWLGNDTLQLTDGGPNEASAAFYSWPA